MKSDVLGAILGYLISKRCEEAHRKRVPLRASGSFVFDSPADDGKLCILNVNCGIYPTLTQYERALLAAKGADANSTSSPPALAEFILAAITKPSHREGLLQCEEEIYFKNVRSRGPRRAAYLYWSAVLWNFSPLFWRTVKRLGIATAAVAVACKVFR